MIITLWTRRSKAFTLKQRIPGVGRTKQFNCLEWTNEMQEKMHKDAWLCLQPNSFFWKRFLLWGLFYGLWASHIKFSCMCLNPYVRLGLCPSYGSFSGICYWLRNLYFKEEMRSCLPCVLSSLSAGIAFWSFQQRWRMHIDQPDKAELQVVVETVRCAVWHPSNLSEDIYTFFMFDPNEHPHKESSKVQHTT